MRLVDSSLFLSATDLSAHLGCKHRTQLERRAAARELSPPSWHDPLRDVLRERGEAHEKSYVEYLQANGVGSVVHLRGEALDPKGMATARAAMEEGAGAIVQAPLVDGRFRGIADVLLRIEVPSDLGDCG